MQLKRYADKLSSNNLHDPHRAKSRTTMPKGDNGDVSDAVEMLRNICVQREWPLPTYVFQYLH